MSDMLVQMILKLVDQWTGPLKQAENELDAFNKAVNDQSGDAAAKKRASHWADEQRAIRKAREEAEAYFTKLEAQMARYAMAASAFHGIASFGEHLGQPIDEANKAAIEFQKQIAEIARASGQIGKEHDLGKGILAAARASNLPWQDVAKGEREMASLGGGEMLNQIAPVRADLAKLAYASGAKIDDLYNVMYHYMEIGHLSAEKALAALQVNYDQGKKGAYELKNLAHGLPQLLGLGKDFGLTGIQSATDLPAILQILRKLTGSPGEADTRLRHGMQKLTDPAEVKRIEKELGVDVSAIRKEAIERGLNPLIAVANALADKLQTTPGAGKLDEEGKKVVGADPDKAGAIARDYYFRSFLSAFTQLRDQLKDFQPDEGAARKQVADDFRQATSTAASALDSLARSADEARIKLGKTQLKDEQTEAGWKKKLLDWASGLADDHPDATKAAARAWNWTSKGLDALGAVGALGFDAVAAYLGWNLLKAKVLHKMGAAAVDPAARAVAGGSEAAAGAAVAAETALPKWLVGIAPAVRSTLGPLLAQSIADAFDQHVIDKPGFMQKVRADEAAEDRRRREGNPFNAIMRPDAANSLQDFFTWLRHPFGGARQPEARAQPVEAAHPAQQSPAAAESAAQTLRLLNGQQVTPSVDASQLDQVVSKGGQAQAALQMINSTFRPNFDLSGFDALLAKIAQVNKAMSSLGGGGHSFSPSAGSLHDGPEAR